MKRTNYFSGFDHKPAHYEDQLTRAFIALLRLVPPVQAAFVDHIREVQLQEDHDKVAPPRSTLESPMTSVWTQKGDLGKDSGRILSILLTNESGEVRQPVKASGRQAVYDGVVHYGDEWVFIVENKPKGDVREDQLDPAVEDGEGWEIVDRAVRIEWKRLIRSLQHLRESEWLDGTQQLLVDDFLTLVHDQFSSLHPYPTLSSCRGRADLIQQRCTDILREVAPEHVEPHGRWMDHITVDLRAARMIGLSMKDQDSDPEIVLALHPGDTVSQARALYRSLDREASRALPSEWKCRPNLHFAHLNRHVFWTQARPDLDRYLSFWQENEQQWVRQVKEEHFEELLGMLEAHGFINETDRENFDEYFLQTNRSSVNVCPGMSMQFRWPLEDASRMDDQGVLKDEVAARVTEAVAVWGAKDEWEEVIVSTDN